jgi:two-component system, probable response regulator PhcQ
VTSSYDHKEFAVLFVDDEEQALKYFRMAFEKDFTVLTASSVDAGWAIVEAMNPPVGVVVTDQRMPGKTGTELLLRVRRSQPDIVRLLATAYSDLEAAIDAVNSGAIYKYLVKPWDVRELRVTLRRAMDYFLLKRERDLLLREKLSALQHLLVADRVRSLAILAEGLSSQIRNTMTALEAYVALAREQAARGPTSPFSEEERWRNLQWETEDATGHLLKLVQGISAATLEPRQEFKDQVVLGELVEASWVDAWRDTPSHGQRMELDIDGELPPLGCSRGMLLRLFSQLFRTLLPPAAGDAEASASVRVIGRKRDRTFGADGVLLEFVRPGFAEGWQKPLLFPMHDLANDTGSPDLLSAFFIVHHHGGTICLDRDHPAGSGFRISLPFKPESITRPNLELDALQKLFADLPRWESLERGG